MKIAVSFTVLLTLIQDVWCFSVSSEADLRQNLFTDKSYDVNVRPAKLVTVSILFNLMAINDLNIRDQSFAASGWLTLVWQDQRLTWNDTEFGNIRFLFATEADVWRPALVVSNSIANLGIIQDAYTPFRITNEGRVIWEPPRIFDVQCQADVRYYPFDEQECSIVIQSWGYNLREVNVTSLGFGISQSEFRPHGEWDITESRAQRGDSTDAKGDEYAQMKFNFIMRRKSEYYWLNVLLPVIVNSILTALVFALPAESGEKMGYTLTVLLSFVVLMTLIADKIPPTSITTPIIVMYFSIVLILASMAVLFSTFVLDIYFRDENDPISGWVRSLFRFLGRVLCYGGCKKRRIAIHRTHLGQITLLKSNGHNLHTPTINVELEKKEDGPSSRSSASWMDLKEETLTWKDISKILDLFLLRVYIITIILVTVCCLTAAYNHVG